MALKIVDALRGWYSPFGGGGTTRTAYNLTPAGGEKLSKPRTGGQHPRPLGNPPLTSL